MILINDLAKEDHHMHTCTFSDGDNTAEEMIRVAGEIGLERIAITDHSKMIIDSYWTNLKRDLSPKLNRDKFKERWQGQQDNGVNVIIGLEADLVNENGDVGDYNWDPCFKEDWLILSAHLYGYDGDGSKVMQGYLKAIQRFGERIKVIGHPYCSRDFSPYTDMKELAKAANDYGIAGEINGKCFSNPERLLDFKQLELMLEHFDRIVINSDAHNTRELENGRLKPFQYLKEKGLVL